MLLYQKLWFPMIVLLGNEDYEITSVLYCAVIHRYTQCYTSVILDVILLLLYTPVYSVPIRNVILKLITCV